MNTPQILTGQQAIDQYSLNALIECRVAINTEFNGLGHIVMGIGVIADPDNCFIDLSDEPAVLYVEIGQDDDSFLHPIMADEHFVLLDDKNTPPAESNAVLAKRIVELTNERDAMAAQVEQLRNGVFHFNRTHGDLNPLLKAVADTPAHCLAEVKAQAVEALKFPTMFRKMWSGGEVQEWLKEEARLLRQSAKPSGTWLKDSNTHCNAKGGV